jgi:hypothetical protein
LDIGIIAGKVVFQSQLKSDTNLVRNRIVVELAVEIPQMTGLLAPSGMEGGK